MLCFARLLCFCEVSTLAYLLHLTYKQVNKNIFLFTVMHFGLPKLPFTKQLCIFVSSYVLLLSYVQISTPKYILVYLTSIYVYLG